jgi:hypothetical protein
MSKDLMSALPVLGIIGILAFVFFGKSLGIGGGNVGGGAPSKNDTFRIAGAYRGKAGGCGCGR